MTPKEQRRFNSQYQRHLRTLKLQGLSDRTIDSYARAVRRLSSHFDACPDRVSSNQLEQYFSDLVDSHSWSTVKVDRNGLQFFWKYILKRDWQWLDIVRAPKVQSLPDILTPKEVEQLISATRKLRFRVFILATYSMGLRLSETLSLEVGDIDAGRREVHIRRGKGHKDRRVPLPDLTKRPASLVTGCLKKNSRFSTSPPQFSVTEPASITPSAAARGTSVRPRRGELPLLVM